MVGAEHEPGDWDVRQSNVDTHIVKVYIGMAYIVMAFRHGLFSYGLYSYGLYSYGLCSWYSMHIPLRILGDKPWYSPTQRAVAWYSA